MKWKTPAEEIPNSKREGIVAWCDGQVTYHNYLNHLDWDCVHSWSYMPQHPKSHNKSSFQLPSLMDVKKEILDNDGTFQYADLVDMAYHIIEKLGNKKR